MPLEHRLRAQSAPLQRPRLEVLDHHVGTGDESLDECEIGSRREVGRESELVAIRGQEVGALPPLVEGRTPAAGLVTRAGTLDFDHIGPQIAEDHAGEWPRENAREVEYSDAIQW